MPKGHRVVLSDDERQILETQCGGASPFEAFGYVEMGRIAMRKRVAKPGIAISVTMISDVQLQGLLSCQSRRSLQNLVAWTNRTERRSVEMS